jgi:hypothetical protein
MRVLSEEKLITYLERVVELSAKVLPLLSAQGTEPPPAKLVKAYQSIVDDLAAERATDEQLQDDSWNWIFQPKEHENSIRLYGRLAWMNLQLLELL